MAGKADAGAASNLRQPSGPDSEPGRVLTAMRAGAAAVRSEAQGLLAACGVPWPAEFDDAVRRYRQAELGWAE